MSRAGDDKHSDENTVINRRIRFRGDDATILYYFGNDRFMIRHKGATRLVHRRFIVFTKGK